MQCMNHVWVASEYSPPPTVTQATGGLSTSQASHAFLEIVANFRLTDEQSAAQFGSLASRTSDPQ